MEADWIEQIKCRRMKLKEMIHLRGKAGRDAQALFDPTAGGKSAPAGSVGSSVLSGARRRRLGHWRGHRRGRLGSALKVVGGVMAAGSALAGYGKKAVKGLPWPRTRVAAGTAAG